MAEARMGTTKSGDVDTKLGKSEEERRAIEQAEELNFDRSSEAEEKQREEGRISSERNEQQDLNQGMETGTHDSVRHGVEWGPAYQARNTANQVSAKKDEPKKTSD